MKKSLKLYLSAFAFLLFAVVGYSQNLVPNPSFEDTVACPSTLNEVSYSNFWSSFGNTPDYYNSCAATSINVPYADPGFQYANTGNAMIGLVTYLSPTAPDGSNYREFVGTQLSTNLIVGQKYYISFFVNYSGYGYPYQRIAANRIGMKFSNSIYTETNPTPLTNSAHYYTDSIIKDTVNWVKLSASFISDSAYSYLILGNFFDSTQTDTSQLGGMPFGGAGAYYYLDDICVTTDSLYNQNWTGIKEGIIKNKISLFPNPSNQNVQIKSNIKIQAMEIIDSYGQSIFKESLYDSFSLTVNLENFASGIYYVKVYTKEKITVSILNINH